ncbi:MAG: trypsin-like peptidase domain-containing protein [Thermoguttaceae bacterium]|nr:trypsin-like peptidase domain-containing protein [Thermoguttaceae bacterium]
MGKIRLIARALRLGAMSMVLVGATVFGVEFRRAQPNCMEDVYDASCRVGVRGAFGSGTFVGTSNDSAYILTNYHVVGKETNATIDFWANGVKQSIAGKVVRRAYDANLPADFAIIAVDANELKRLVDPPFVALGGRDSHPGVDAFFLSSGGPKGWAVKAWKGKTLGYYSGETALFQPHPVPGQSGSGIFEIIDNELFQTGIITWLIGEEGDDKAQGGAIPIANLYRALQGYNVSEPRNASPIPPGAKECAERFQGLYFRRDNCSSCDEVAHDVSRINELLPVEVVDCGTDDGYKRALSFAITELPTLVIASSDEARAVVSYNDMRRTSLYDATKAALEKLAVKEAKLENNADPRLRPPVYELPNVAHANFLDQSDLRWNQRGKEPQEGAKFGDGALVDDAVDKLGGRLEERVSGLLEPQIDKIENRVVHAVKSTIRAYLIWGALSVIALIWIANLFGVAIVKCFQWLGRKIKLAVLEAMYRVNEKLEVKFKGESK